MTNYETKDQFLATILFSFEADFLGAENKDGVIFFTFKGQKKCADIITKHYQGNLEIISKKFVDAHITVKHLIHGAK